MVDFMLVPAKYQKEILLPKGLLNKVKNKKIALFASVQFTNLAKALLQLKENSTAILNIKAKRASTKFQILGCDCDPDSFSKEIKKAEIILCIGDGMFHPKALLLANLKNIIIFNPISKKVINLTKNEIELQRKKYKANLIKYLSAKKVGILITTKTGQEYLNAARELKKQNKQFFLFLDDTFDFHNMENFPFIDVWINSACPRIGLDDSLNLPRPLINIKDAFNPKKALENVY